MTKGKIATNGVGTAEVIDHGLTGADIARASGALGYDFPPILAGACEVAPGFSGSSQIPAGAAEGTVVLVGTPPGTPNGITIDGRAVNGDTIGLQACNMTNAPIDPPSLAFPFVTITP